MNGLHRRTAAHEPRSKLMTPCLSANSSAKGSCYLFSRFQEIRTSELGPAALQPELQLSLRVLCGLVRCGPGSQTPAGRIPAQDEDGSDPSDFEWLASL